ncbi:MAG: hypothetical protein ABFS02_07785, partial [Pseudomonadota bacterium]
MSGRSRGALFMLAMAIGLTAWAANQNGLDVVDSVSAYRRRAESDSRFRLVDLSQFAPSVRLDIKYATSDNFTGKVLYPSAK